MFLTSTLYFSNRTMIDELEALVGHLYVVGGRAISAPPPGALVQLAPKRVPRSRERDAFFGLVLPTPGAQAKAVFYERMVQLAAERYFNSQGGVTAGLREVLAMLNDDLLAHNREHPEHPFYADMVCAVLRGHEIYVARTGGGLVLLWQDGALETFPYDLDDPDLINGQPLGYAPEPDLKMAHYEVQPGHMLTLSDAHLARPGRAALAAVGTEGGIQGMAARLRTHGFLMVSAMIIELITADAPDPLPSVPAASPSAPVEAAAPSPVSMSGEASPLTTAAAETPPARRARFRLPWSRGEGGRLSARAAVVALPRLSLEEIQVGGQSALRRLARGGLLLMQRILGGLIRLLTRIRHLLDKILPEPEAGRPPSLPTPLAMGAAILIPVAVVLLVVALALTMRDETSFERCLSQAEVVVGVARQATANGTANEQQAWFGALEAINQCAPRRPNDPVLLSLRREAQGHLDRFARVVRCPAVPLRRFQPGADLRGPVLQGGVELYTLDVQRSTIYRDLLTDEGNALIREGEVLVQRGSAVGEFVIRDLVDIAWLTEGGASRRSVLIGLDRRGVLLSYSPTFPPATAQALVGADRWIRPTAIATWQGRLYILDPVANQIWRYQPSGGAYPGAPEEYFAGESRPDLSNAVDLAIHEGDVYVLFADGSMQKFTAGQGGFFQFVNLPSGFGTLGSANAMYLDTGLISPGFYVLDAATLTIYETTLAGTFIRAYREPEGASFRDITGLAVDDSAQNIYLAARNTLYHIRKCE